MNAAAWERLRSLQVADVMQTQVVTLHAYQTMTEAAQVLLEHNITGAPVVDEQGRVVGILSAVDFVRSKAQENLACSTQLSPLEFRTVHDEQTSTWCLEPVESDRVQAHMSQPVHTIAPHAPLAEAARIMCTQHIHRLVVIDRHGFPIGVLTSLDLTAALMQAVEEATG